MPENNIPLNDLLPEAAPESQGIHSGDLADFLTKMESEGIELHSLKIVRNGYLILNYTRKPLTEDSWHRIYSSAKGLLTTAVLFAVQEGLLDLHEKIADIFPDRLPETVPDDMRQITVYHLLNMASGHDHNIFHELRHEADWIKGFFRIPIRYRPGDVFVYNNACPHIIAQVILRKTGLDVPEYLSERFLKPVGIRMHIGYNWNGELEPTTTVLTPDGMLRYTLFYLKEGEWNGKQLLKKELVRMVGKRHVPTPNDTTYGFGLYGTPDRTGGFHFHGGMTNHAIIARRENMAMALLCNERREDYIFNEIDRFIISRTYEDALPENPEAYRKLKQKESEASLVYPGTPVSQDGTELTAEGKVYLMEANAGGLEEISFSFGDRISIVTRSRGRTEHFFCGLNGMWEENGSFLITEPDDSTRPEVKGYVPNIIPECDKYPVFLSAVWQKNELILFMRSAYYMSTTRYHCFFRGDGITIKAHTYFLPEEPPAGAYKNGGNSLTGHSK